MELSFDILDYIFGFLRHDTESLIACSRADFVFSPIVERHLYYHIIILVHTSTDFETTGHGYCLKPTDLIKRLSETPHIVDHVRVLQITHSDYQSYPEMYEEITPILPKFSLLECFTLSSFLKWQGLCQSCQSLKKAVEDCLRLPMLQEVHIGIAEFPLSMLHNHANINCLSLSESPKTPEFNDSCLQLKSLTIEDFDYRPFSTWAKRHIIGLHSLKCEYSNEKLVLDFLEICSGILNNLDITLQSPCEGLSLFWI